MKSFSRVTTSSTSHQNWEIPDLIVEAVQPDIQVQSEQLLAIFGMGQKTAASVRESGRRSNIHSYGKEVSLANWLPDDIARQPRAVSQEQWDFIETFANSLKTADPESVRNRPATEKEKSKLLMEAREHAGEILAAARAEAEKIIQQSQTISEQAKKDGYEQGWNASRSELQDAVTATRELVQQTQEWQAAFFNEGEHILTGMLKELAEAMFGEGVRLDAEGLQVNLNRIMENAQRLGDMNIFLNPKDANLLDASWRDYQLLITGNKVRIIPSDKVKPGGCLIKGNMGMVDARVETQLTAILNRIDEVTEVGK
jgi:flagellar assembly protein FliH